MRRTTRWKVDDGMLCAAGQQRRATRTARCDIVTTETFTDFELRWEWRISLGGNSGVKYFVLEDQDSAIGHEYQVIDDARHPGREGRAAPADGAFYDVLRRRIGPCVRPASSTEPRSSSPATTSSTG